MSGFRNYGMSSNNRNNHQGGDRFYNNARNNSVPAFRRNLPHRQQHQQHHHNYHNNNNQYPYQYRYHYNQYQQQDQEEEDFYTRQQQMQQLEYTLNGYRQTMHGQWLLEHHHWEEVQRQIQVRNAAEDLVGTSTQAQDAAGTDDTKEEQKIIVTIIDRFSQSVTPYVLVQCLSKHQTGMDGAKARERDVRPFFNLGDLWDCYEEWSVYGAGVPLTLSGNQAIVQYYVPSLSGIQLYIEDPSDTNSPGLLVFEHLEVERPYNRLPLYDQIGVLSAQCPMLMTLNSCDLMPTSWIAVAWYPIYMIPSGLTLKKVDACFLTFHCLSTKPAAGNKEPQHGAGTWASSSTIHLPLFGLASYKLRGSSILKTGGDKEEQQQQNCMMNTADTWLKARKVHLPDFSFFASRWRVADDGQVLEGTRRSTRERRPNPRYNAQ